MVQEVERLSSKLDVDSFSDVCPLYDRQIVVGLEWSSEDVAAEIANRRITSARRIATANDNVLIVNASATRNERIEVDVVIDPIRGATGRQDRTRANCRAAAVDEVSVLQ